MAPIVADRDLSQKRQIHSMNMTFAEVRANLTAFTGTVFPSLCCFGESVVSLSGGPD